MLACRSGLTQTAQPSAFAHKGTTVFDLLDRLPGVRLTWSLGLPGPTVLYEDEVALPRADREVGAHIAALPTHERLPPAARPVRHFHGIEPCRCQAVQEGAGSLAGPSRGQTYQVPPDAQSQSWT